jgi:hypothetical protein
MKKFLAIVVSLLALNFNLSSPIGVSMGKLLAAGQEHEEAPIGHEEDAHCEKCKHEKCPGDCSKCEECQAKAKAEECKVCLHEKCPGKCERCPDCIAEKKQKQRQRSGY